VSRKRRQTKKRTCFEGAGEKLDGGVLVGEGGVSLVVEPSQLLKNLGVLRALGEHLFVSLL